MCTPIYQLGLCNSPNIFQEKMRDLFADLESVRAFIDNLLILTKDTWNIHLKQLDLLLNRLDQAGLKINIKKGFIWKARVRISNLYN